ncbi:heterochromatin protein 1-like isoform X1 [Rhopalosiphum maidis]|uniref:heterochromatin protein 1-like isoform X1 n=1 Tax=Rhopalosiphum maidis TaxID=43146 RepID=UPI000EFFC838|nr:heterochromatin protein 1-like isoform X1 [Rhopalosiphum maidis]
MNPSPNKVTENDTDSSSSSKEQENLIITSCTSSDSMSSRGHTSLPPEEMDVNPDESEHDDSKHQYEAEKIIALTNFGGSLTFLVKFKGINEADWIPANEANKKFPRIVIDYYLSLPINWIKQKLNDNQ